MNTQKLERLYHTVITNNILSFEIMISAGFSQGDIQYFIENGIFECTSLKEYKFCDASGLYKYAVKKLHLGAIKDSYLSFLKCYELDSKNTDVCIQLILFAIKNGHYNQAFEYFKDLEQISNEKDQYNNNLYLYLLSLLTGCPNEYLERINNLDFDSIQIPRECDTPRTQSTNYVRQAIMKNQYKHALFLQNEMIAKTQTYSPQDALLKEMILRIVRKEEEFELMILDFAKSKDYKAIISFIETRKKKRYLSNNEAYILLITKAINEITNTKQIPPVTIDSTEYIYEAIIGNNYKLAQRLHLKFSSRSGKQIINEILTILLSDINYLISQLQHSDIEQTSSNKVFTYTKALTKTTSQL